MKKVKVLSPVRFDGQRYAVDDEFTMVPEEAERLVGLGVLEVIGDAEEDETMTVPEIKAALDELKVEYDKKAKKDELLALLEAQEQKE